MGRRAVVREVTGSSRRALPRGAALAVVLAVAGAFSCQPTAARVVSASPEAMTEHATQSMVLDTAGCAPAFDVDRGGLADDPTASLVVGDDAAVVVARRTLDEQFEADLPNDLLPGSYALTLVLADGRRAAYAGRLQVEPLPIQIDAVRSTRSSAVLGESSLPLSVELSNPGGCAVEGLTITPVFSRDGVDDSGDFTLSDPGPVAIAPGGSTVVDFTAAIGLSAMSGVVQIDARATGGHRTGSSGCTGPVSAEGAATVSRWVIVAPGRASLVVADISANPSDPQAGGRVNVAVTVRNDAPVAITLATLDLSSEPQGLIVSAPPRLDAQALGPGYSASYTLHATIPDGVASGTVYTLTVTATGRDGAGNVYASAVPAPSVTVTTR